MYAVSPETAPSFTSAVVVTFLNNQMDLAYGVRRVIWRNGVIIDKGSQLYWTKQCIEKLLLPDVPAVIMEMLKAEACQCTWGVTAADVRGR